MSKPCENHVVFKPGCTKCETPQVMTVGDLLKIIGEIRTVEGMIEELGGYTNRDGDALEMRLADLKNIPIGRVKP